MRKPPVGRPIALAMSVSLALVTHDVLADSIAYAEAFDPSFDFVRIDFTAGSMESIGPLSIYFAAGSFVDDDFSKEYVIDYPFADLYSVDTSNAELTLVGNVSTPGSSPKGMHWDRASDQTFMITVDDSCSTSTLYTLDVSNASIAEVGSSPGCIAGLAIDASGRAFGVDLVADTLVSIDTTTGAATTVGPLGFNANFAIGGFDFDLSSGALYLFAYDLNTFSNGIYVVDTTTGSATLIGPDTTGYAGLAFARDVDPIFVNGFDARSGNFSTQQQRH